MKLRQRFRIVLLGILEEHSIRQACQGAGEYVATHKDLAFEPWVVYPNEKLAGAVGKLNRADGLLIAEGDWKALNLTRLRLRVPRVFFLGTDRHSTTPAVRLDEVMIGRMAAEHLIHRGYRHVAFFGYRGIPWSILRAQGFQQAAGAGGATAVEYIFPPATLPMYLSGRFAQRRYGLYQALRALEKPCGIFTANDILAYHTIDAARELGWRVPEQVGVIGVDDDPIANAAAGLPISTIETPLRQAGWRAAEILDCLRRGKGKVKDIILPPIRVVVRTSTDTFMAPDHLVRRAQSYIEARRDKGLHVGEMVRELRTTADTLHRHFFEHLKISPGAYIRQRRMEYAKELLRAGKLSVKEVCYACGFDDHSFFCRTFKRVTGTTPGSLRPRRFISDGR